MANQPTQPAVRASHVQQAVPPRQQSIQAKAAEPDEYDEGDAESGETYASVMQQMPSWLTSTVVHMVILLAAGLWLLPPIKGEKEHSLVVSNVESLEEDEEVLDEQFSLDEEEIVEDPIETQVLPQDVPVDNTTIDSDFNDLAAAESVPTLDVPAIQADFGALMETDRQHLKTHTGGKEFKGRGKMQRQRMVGREGGTMKSELAVENALKWIAAHQAAGGNWDFDLSKCVGGCTCKSHGGGGAAIGATSLGLLPFLGAGYTHKDGKHKNTVWKGLNYLITKMKPHKASGGGDLSDPRGRMYSHGLAAIVLSEAYGMTEDSRLRDPARAALRFIVYAQHPAGGWRYKPGDAGDTSAVGWQIMALKSGVMGGVVEKKSLVPVFKKAGKFLDSVSSDSGAFYGYTKPGRGTATTAVGHLAKMYLGLGKEDPGLQRGAEWMSKKGPTHENMYYSYYATQVMHHMGGEQWKKWNKQMRDPLVKAQAKRGHEAGSWMFAGGDHGYKIGGRLYATSMATMLLEVYYRHMPLYKNKSADAVDLDAWDLD